jgi:hypothetical protein
MLFPAPDSFFLEPRKKMWGQAYPKGVLSQRPGLAMLTGGIDSGTRIKAPQRFKPGRPCLDVLYQSFL